MSILLRAILGFFLLINITPAIAAPVLRLLSSTVGPVSIATGSAGPVQTVEAFNSGDGNLNLQFSTSQTWAVPTAGALRPCSSQSGNCLPIQVALQTSALPRGIYTAVITVNDTNAVDAPQTITVTVQIGGGVPDRVDLFVPPTGASASVRFSTNGAVQGLASTQSGGAWLSMSLDGGGTFQFPVSYRITGRHLTGMAPGDYNGSIQISNSALPADNKTVPVTLRVTTQPIAQASAEKLQFRIRQSFVKFSQYLTIVNQGQGTLNVSAVTPSTFSSGNWLSVRALGGTTYEITADPAGLGLGIYRGSLTVVSNAANGSLNVPVELEIIAAGPPRAFYGGAVNIATYDSTEPVSPGAIVAVFGEQLSYADPVEGRQLPLVTELGGAQVFVNDRRAPLYFTSYGQINFQIPYETPSGRAVVRVDRDGQTGNRISIDVTERAARILPRGIGDYGIVIVNEPDNRWAYAMPAAVAAQYGLQGRMARKGEYAVMYVVGMGQTSPPVASGAPAPDREPLARILPNPKIEFGGFGPVTTGITSDAAYAGLTPGLVGLYQVNFQVPANAPAGERVPIRLVIGGAPASNTVWMAIE